MTRFSMLLIMCGLCLALLAVAGCGKKEASGKNIHGPALTPYRQQPPEKLEPIEIPPVMKEHKDIPAGK
ncbi:MAG: hypothetical protein ACYDCO_03620 [Armatimonadota bacterium]